MHKREQKKIKSTKSRQTLTFKRTVFLSSASIYMFSSMFGMACPQTGTGATLIRAFLKPTEENYIDHCETKLRQFHIHREETGNNSGHKASMVLPFGSDPLIHSNLESRTVRLAKDALNVLSLASMLGLVQCTVVLPCISLPSCRPNAGISSDGNFSFSVTKK